MSIFITGATGYVGKHLLRYFLSLTNKQIVVCIREKNGDSGKVRFQKEIVKHGLFTNIKTKNRIRVVEKDVSDLTSEDLKDCTDIVHCAANVKFNSKLELLLNENVDSLKKLYSLCYEKRFYHISTCYVHPTVSEGPYESKKIEPDLKISDFICNYAYTKYLAEQFLYQQKGTIDIIRLSCVGAPIEDLAPMRGGAHLAILELLERSKLPDVWMPDNLQFSVVPVDIVCKGIIDKLKSTHEGVKISQFSAPAESETYNINVKNILKEKSFSTKIWTNVSYKKFVAWMNLFYWLVPNILKRIIGANDVISYVSSNQTFYSDLILPNLSAKEYSEKTLAYTQKLAGSTNIIIKVFLYLFSHLKSLVVWVFDPWVDEE